MLGRKRVIGSGDSILLLSSSSDRFDKIKTGEKFEKLVWKNKKNEMIKCGSIKNGPRLSCLNSLHLLVNTSHHTFDDLLVSWAYM